MSKRVRAKSVPRHRPLADDLAAVNSVRSEKRRKNGHNDDHDGREDARVDSRTSRKILQIGQDLQQEEESERIPQTAFTFASRYDTGEVVSEDELEAQGFAGERRDVAGDTGAEDEWGSDEDNEEVSEENKTRWSDGQEMAPQDLALFNKLYPDSAADAIDDIFPSDAPDTGAAGETTNLSELILEKIAAHEARHGDVVMDEVSPGTKVQGGGSIEDAVELPAKVVEVYSK